MFRHWQSHVHISTSFCLVHPEPHHTERGLALKFGMWFEDSECHDYLQVGTCWGFIAISGANWMLLIFEFQLWRIILLKAINSHLTCRHADHNRSGNWIRYVYLGLVLASILVLDEWIWIPPLNPKLSPITLLDKIWFSDRVESYLLPKVAAYHSLGRDSISWLCRILPSDFLLYPNPLYSEWH